jgi:hypothetical protein
MKTSKESQAISLSWGFDAANPFLAKNNSAHRRKTKRGRRRCLLCYLTWRWGGLEPVEILYENLMNLYI